MGVRGMVRDRAIKVIDRAGQRERVAEWYGRFSPSRQVRRDHRDMSLMAALVTQALGGGRVGVDVGANVGTVAAMMHAASPDARHILIEPVAELAERLRQRFPDDTIVSSVCGSTTHDVEFNVAVQRMTRSSVYSGMARSGGPVDVRTVPQSTIDTIVGDQVVGLVKIDVEGAELDVLQGARATLDRSRPVVLFEHTRSSDVTTESSVAIAALLDERRYRLFTIDGGAALTADAFVECVDRGRLWTFMAVPSER